jgi:hypothetical protein
MYKNFTIIAARRDCDIEENLAVQEGSNLA